jgi:hypothetical protein
MNSQVMFQIFYEETGADDSRFWRLRDPLVDHLSTISESVAEMHWIVTRIRPVCQTSLDFNHPEQVKETYPMIRSQIVDLFRVYE